MMDAASTRVSRGPKAGEEGYMLLGVVILLALVVIATAVAAPRVAKQLQRDRDLETMHRGKQYIRAIRLYYNRFHAYPPNVEALVKTNEIRFLRKRYIDPTTGKDDWKPIAFGQNKQPIAFGFFGQPLGGTGGSGVLAGTGPSGGNGIDGTGTGLGNSLGGSSLGGSTLGGSSPTGNTGITGGIGTSSPTGTTSGTGTGTSSSSGDTLSGQTFGGGGIIGFSPASPRQSILVYKKMNHYNEWEFTYSPQMDMQQIPGAGGSGTLPTNGTGSSNGGIGGGSLGSGNGSTGSGGTTTSPTSPQ